MSKARNLSDFISTASIDTTEIADGAVTHAKLHTDMDLSSKTVTFADDHISGNKIHGGIISGFASTGIDDNASSTAITIDSNRYVGLFTANPVVPFHIENEGMRIARNSGDAYIQLTQQGSTDVSLYGGPNGFRVFNGTSESLRVNSSGHLGIGTTNPVYTLTVSEDGNDNIEIGAGIIQRYNRGSASYGNITYYGSAHNIISLSNDIKLESRSSDTSFNSGVTAKIELDTVGTGYGQIRMSTGGGGGGMNTDAFVVAPTGNIGIGTNSPVSRLDVRGAIRLDQDGNGTGYITKGFSTAHDTNNRTKHVAFGIQDGSFAGIIARNGIGGNSSFNSQHLEFHVHNGGIVAGEAMRIWYNKHVGIHTTAPERNLHVVGSGTGDYEMRVGAGGGLSQNATLDVVATHDSYIFQCWDDNNLTTPRFVVERGGEVGIGLTNPTQKLHVNGNIRATTFIHRTGNSGGIGANETEAIYFGGSSAVFHDNVNLSSAGQAIFRMGGSRAELLRMRNNSGYAIYAENGSITSASDHRIKTDVTEIPNAWEKVKQINPIEYRHTDEWDADNTDRRLTGFIAHELQELIPAAVGGVKDEVDDEGNPVMQGVDYGRVTPLLAAALKQALTRIEELESRLNAAGL